MLDFKAIEITDKERYEYFLHKHKLLNCDYCFNDLYLWREYYKVSVFQDEHCFYIKMKNKGFTLFYPPLGDTKHGIEKLKDYTRANNILLVFTCVEDSMLEYFPYSEYRIVPKRDNADYIYLHEDLSSLKGSRYKQKRNFVNTFINEYENRFEVYSLNQVTKEDLGILSIWFAEQKTENIDTFKHEKSAILEAIKLQEELGLVGCGIRLEGETKAICIGSIVGDTFICHFEKADTNIRGIFQAINYFMANRLSDDIRYINREEDIGLLNLRKAKLSYHPTILAMNYNAYYKRDDFIVEEYNGPKEALIKLWQTSFMDGDYSKWYFNHMDNYVCYVAKRNNTIAGMVILYNQEYIYALCVAEEYRNHGVGGLLISHLKERYDNLYLIAGSEKLERYYLNLGFIKSVRAYSTVIVASLKEEPSEFIEVDYARLAQIYDTVTSNKLKRNPRFFELYLTQPNISCLMSNAGYAIYYIEDGEVVIVECIAKDYRAFTLQVLSYLKLKQARVVSVTGDSPLYVFQTYSEDEFVYKNLLWD